MPEDLAQLTRGETEKYKRLSKERFGYALKSMLVYPLMINFELTQMQIMLRAEEPQMQDANLVCAGAMGVVLLVTAVNYALNIIDERRTFKEIKNLEQRMKQK